MKRYICILFCFILIFLGSCEKTNKPEEVSKGKPEEGETAVSETVSQNIDVENLLLKKYKKYIEIDKSSLFSDKKQTICYGHVMSQYLDDYVNQLISYGFTPTKLPNSYYDYYFEKDDLCIYMRSYVIIGSSSTEFLSYISYAKRPAGERKNAVSAVEAKSLIGIENQELVEIYVPDLYEKMHAQLFVTPKDGQILLIKNRKVYAPVNGTIPYSISPFGDFIVCDINKDNSYELVYITNGTTSEEYTVRIASVNLTDDNPVIKYSGNIYLYFNEFTDYGYISLTEESNDNVNVSYYQYQNDESGSPSAIRVRKRLELSEDSIYLTDI